MTSLIAPYPFQSLGMINFLFFCWNQTNQPWIQFTLYPLLEGLHLRSWAIDSGLSECLIYTRQLQVSIWQVNALCPFTKSAVILNNHCITFAIPFVGAMGTHSIFSVDEK